jgi:hypothetical protein
MNRVQRVIWAVSSVVAACAMDGGAPTGRDVANASVVAGNAGNAVVVAWSEKAYEIAFAEDSFRTFKGHRAFAMMHLAMHDAINGAEPRYGQYAFFGRDSLADPVSAAAQAAHDVLRAHYPGAAAALAAALRTTLAGAPNASSSARGIVLGRDAAAAIIKARRDDGWDVQGKYAFDDRPGAYRTTPPWNGFVAQPGFRQAKPFGLRAPDQFRSSPPPALGTANYAVAFNEVKDAGRIDSSTRTPDQTAYAIWWMEFAEGSVNRLTRRLVTDRQLPLAETARLFALLNVSLFDNYVAVWDTKYEYNHWRPYSAIRAAARDGNAATDPDSAWQPLRVMPPSPEYVSAHAGGCAASFEILRRTLGDGAFTMETITAPTGMPTRSFTSFGAAASECADSRVRLGWHFRYATEAGLALGRGVAGYVAERHLLPLTVPRIPDSSHHSDSP